MRRFLQTEPSRPEIPDGLNSGQGSFPALRGPGGGLTASTTSAGTTASDTYSDITSDQRTAYGSTSYANGLLGVTRQTLSGTSAEFIRDPNGNLVALESGGSSYYYTADALGSTILLSNSSDAAAATYTYDTWGKITSTVTGIGATNPYRYAGGAQDSNGLTKFGTRYYDPTTGRFTQTDPSGQEQNRYIYAGDNPVSDDDPSGRLSITLLIKIIDALVAGHDVADLLSANSNTAGIEAAFAVGCGVAAGFIAADTGPGILLAEGGCLLLDAMFDKDLEDGS